MNLFTKHFLLKFLIFFEIILITLFIFYFDFSIENIRYLSKWLIFDIFILEFLIVFLLTYFLWEKLPILTLVISIIILLFIGINTIQLISYSISSDFLSQTALNNIEFIGFLFTEKNITTILFILAILLILPYTVSYILRFLKIPSLLILFLIILLSTIIMELTTISQTYKEEKEKLFTHNNLHHTAPISSFIQLFIPKKKIDVYFSNKDIQQLNHTGFFFNPTATYPLMKDKTYNSTVDFNSTLEKPNIILLFTEGMSARTLSMYNSKFKDLTPHLQRFSNNSHTMIAKDYYNHTAATYKGLHGQLCSWFPSLGGMQWNHTIPNSENIHYSCITNILKAHNYDTSYLNVHYKEKSGNDEMASHLGYTHVLSAKELSNRYLGGVNHIRKNELTDHQAYRSLTKYLKERSEKPFFITMYTAETHAWCNTRKDGVVYKEGKNEVLNTIHNLDHAFGKFWDYFIHSKYANNTIIIFTADHAHYFDPAFVALMKKKKERYHKMFIDKIPLLIYAPTHILPKILHTNQSTSLDLAPTLMHLLSIQKEKNAFLGHTIFENSQDTTHTGIAAYNSNLYAIAKGHIHYNKQTSTQGKIFFDLIAKYFEYMKQLELQDSIFKK